MKETWEINPTKPGRGRSDHRHQLTHKSPGADLVRVTTPEQDVNINTN